MDTQFDLKTVEFFGRQCMVLCQNKNGPCPLLAIANVLLLQNVIFIHSDKSIITLHELIEIVANIFVEKGLPHGCSGEPRADMIQQQLNSVLNTLPGLANGLDLNVHFSGVTDFEFTEEISVFDALDIPLLHGWVLDPQDIVTSMTIQRDSSYNHLMNKLVEYRSLLETFSSPIQMPTVPTNIDSFHDTPPSLDENISTEIEFDKLTDDNWEKLAEANEKVSQKADEKSPEQNQADTSPYILVTFEGDQTEVASESCSGTIPDISRPKDDDSVDDLPVLNFYVDSKSVQDVEGKQSSDLKPLEEKANKNSSKKNEELLKEGEIIESFLSTTASQLTIIGLMSLHQNIRERQFAVFFRNNHFSTLYRYENRLYLLVTDLGYQNEPSVVWELLDGIDGDTEYVDAYFIKTSAQTHSLSFSSSSIPNSSDPAIVGSIRFPDSNKAHSSQIYQQGQNHGHVQNNNRSDNDRVDTELDPDLLFALQLQDEENEQEKQRRNQMRTSNKQSNSIGTIATQPRPSEQSQGGRLGSESRPQSQRSQSQGRTKISDEKQGTRILTQSLPNDNLASSCLIC